MVVVLADALAGPLFATADALADFLQLHSLLTHLPSVAVEVMGALSCGYL